MYKEESMRYEMTTLRRYTALDKVEKRVSEMYRDGMEQDPRVVWAEACDFVAGVPGHDEDKPLAEWLKSQWLGPVAIPF
jgi:hypothetical protein